jgi:pimeloyl-ACP methyl ester carboxylesterase
MAATVTLPETLVGAVVLADGAGGRTSRQRHRRLAAALYGRRLGTIVVDVAAGHESLGCSRLDLDNAADRLVSALAAVESEPRLNGVALGMFGWERNGAAALIVAGQGHLDRGALVCCSTHLDARDPILKNVHVPTLLLAGGRDDESVSAARRLSAGLPCLNHLAVVPLAGRSFREPGALDTAVEITADWFSTHLR